MGWGCRMNVNDVEKARVAFGAAVTAAEAILPFAGEAEVVPAIAAVAPLLNSLALLIEQHMRSHPTTVAGVDDEVDRAENDKLKGSP